MAPQGHGHGSNGELSRENGAAPPRPPCRRRAALRGGREAASLTAGKAEGAWGAAAPTPVFPQHGAVPRPRTSSRRSPWLARAGQLSRRRLAGPRKSVRKVMAFHVFSSQAVALKGPSELAALCLNLNDIRFP